MKTTKIITITALCLNSQLLAFGGGGGPPSATEATQIRNRIILAGQLSKVTQQYSTQLQQFDLERIMARVFDTGQFADSLELLDEYQNIFSITSADSAIQSIKTQQDYAQSGGGGASDATQSYLEKVEDASGVEYDLVKQHSELNKARHESIESDKELVKDMQIANRNAVGAMQAAQIGNHINSEVLAQLVKMREEAATSEEMEALLRKEQLEQEALNKALREADKQRRQESLQRLRAEAQNDNYKDLRPE